jgi:YgiT-type zinc finger domain-containing protein
MKCPICDSPMKDMTHQRVHTTAYEHAIYFAEYSRCDQCGEELVSPLQADRNDAKLREVLGVHPKFPSTK